MLRGKGIELREKWERRGESPGRRFSAACPERRLYGLAHAVDALDLRRTSESGNRALKVLSLLPRE